MNYFTFKECDELIWMAIKFAYTHGYMDKIMDFYNKDYGLYDSRLKEVFEKFNLNDKHKASKSWKTKLAQETINNILNCLYTETKMFDELIKLNEKSPNINHLKSQKIGFESAIRSIESLKKEARRKDI